MADIGTAFLKVMPDMTTLNARMGAYFTSSQWGKLGAGAGAALGAGLAAGATVKGLYEIGQAFDEVDDKISASTGATGKRLKELRGAFDDVVSKVPVDFEIAGDAVSELAQRTDLADRPLSRLASQLAALSKVTGEDVNDTVAASTRLFGDWSIKTSKQGDTLDRLFRLTQMTGIGMTDLSELLVQFGSPLRQLGFSLDEAAVMFGRFEREGVNMQTLLPGLRMGLKNIAVPTEELGKKFKQLGIDTSEPRQALYDIFEILEKDKISEADQTLLASEVFGGRAWADMKAAVEEGRFEFEDLMGAIKDGDETIRGAERRTRDFDEQWLMFKNNLALQLEPVAHRVFEYLGDKMKEITRIMRDEDLTDTERFEKVLDVVGEVFGKVLDKAAEMGPKIVGKLLDTFLDAWLDSNVWGKLFLGGTFLMLIGGRKAFAKIGIALAKWIAAPIMTTIAAEMAAGAAASSMATSWKNIGKVMGRFIGIGAIAALVLALTDEDVREKIKDIIEGEKLDAPSSEELHQQILDDSAAGATGLSASQLSIPRSGQVKVDSSLGGILFDAEKGKVIRAEGKKLQFLVGKTWDEVYQEMATQGSRWDKTQSRTFMSSKRFEKQFLHDMPDASKDGWAAITRHAEQGNRELRDDLDKTTKHSGRRHEEAHDKADKETRGTKADVTSNIGGMTNRVADILDTYRDNLNNALDSVGVKDIVFSVAKVATSALNVFRQKGGLVPGYGTGDTVPLHIGGSLAAWVEPGEQVSVLNRKATEAMMAANKAIPRFASGGLVQALGPYSIPPIVADPNHGANPTHANSHLHLSFTSPSVAQAFARQIAPLGWVASEAPWAGGITVVHQDQGHYTGAAFDANALDESYGAVAQVARMLGGAGGGAVGVAAEKLKRLGLKGPGGMLRNFGQAGADKVYKAMNAYLAKQTPTIAGLEMGGKSQGVYSVDEMAGLWTQAGGAKSLAHLMGAIGMAESTGNPRALNSIGAKGLWQIIPSTASAFGLNYGKLFDPLYNAGGAVKIHGEQGLGAWEAYTLGMHQQYLQRGGKVLPYLGKFHSGGVAERDGLAHVAKDEAMVPGGGGWELRIVNWEEGTGYIKRVGGSAVRSARHHDTRLARMGGRS